MTSSASSSAGRLAGLGLAAMAGICQGSGLVLSKIGMGHARAAAPVGPPAPAEALADPTPGGVAAAEMAAAEMVDPWIATTWRMLAAAAAIAVIVLLRRGPLRGLLRRGDASLRPRPVAADRTAAAWLVAAGTLLGPVAGVWLSMVAVDRAEAGPASTLMATSPILILPVVRIVERERIGPRAILGAIVAVSGVGMLAFAGSG